jgi:hypothetical protein
MWHHLYHVFTYFYFLLIEKDICDCRNVSVNLPYVVCFSLGDLFTFLVKVSPFFSYFYAIRTSVLSLFMWFLLIIPLKDRILPVLMSADQQDLVR